ncbi:hypothetical protein KIW84_065672 [Lathyrus oleraceus]|uniref:DUF4218 domain-containing protein n=1 Tax=Pisum sativum TaxID=3888 RepID=A0A9D4WFT3_PEA|nr:hypothetical protein KIW84_065672 [Pisum sativum]
MGKLKSHNKAKPEGSIVEGYHFEEILTFCSRYLENIDARWIQPRRVDDDPIGDIQTGSRVSELFPRVGKPVGGSFYYTLTPIEKLQPHRHVLTNYPIVDDYLKKFRSITQNQMKHSQRSVNEINKKVYREFVHWFRNRICNNLDNIHGLDKDVLISLAYGPFDKSMKGRPRFVQPGELEVNKKRICSTTTRKSSITPPPTKTTITHLPIQTTVTPPPIETTITPPPIQTTKDVVVEDKDGDVVVGDGTEDDVVGD